MTKLISNIENLGDYTNAFVVQPSVGFGERLSTGERVISLEGVEVGCWGGGGRGKRVVRYAWWKTMWENSRHNGVRARSIAAEAMVQIL